MAKLGELERLTDEEAADLGKRVERFRAAWRAEGSPPLGGFLPPKGTRHRQLVLIQLAIADMDRRAQAELPCRAEKYLKDFSGELTLDTIPVPLLAREYVLRHHFADKPDLEDYRRRFPAQFESLREYLSHYAAANVTAGPQEYTPLTSVPVLPESSPRLDGFTIKSAPVPPPPSKPPSGLVDTGSVHLPDISSHGFGSTILPNDTPYTLVRKLGSGAFGEVYEALAPGGVRVAVKRILRTVDHPASKSERESLEAIKELSHPFLLKTNAYWVFDDRLVIVMELADGSLADRIVHHQTQGRPGIPPEELIPIFEQASEALDYLHSQNVSHRDIKPENVLILRGYAKVGDFGLARIQEHTLTVVQNTVGTPAYMAPEMWKQRVSLHSDQYSLAATYVRARLGRQLFTTNVLVDLANFHINETPNLDPLPRAEQKVLLKALAKDPEHRYRSCREFAKALRAAALPEPVPPPQGSGLLVKALAAILLCVAAAGAAVWFTRDKSQPVQPVEKENNDKGPVVIIPPPEKKYAIYPRGWEPSEADGERFIGDRYYHLKLTRKIGERELAAYLVYPTAASHPDPFYMTEDKITNNVFRTVWNSIAGSPTVQGILNDQLRQHLLPGRWRKSEGGKVLDLDGADAELPVLGVTVPEAMLVAEALNGSLPSYQQWQKATGALEDFAGQGPAGLPLEIPEQYRKSPTDMTEMERKDFLRWKREQFEQRHLALARIKNGASEGPLPVTAEGASRDLSRWKIRQLVSNGQEWLAQSTSDASTRFSLFPLNTGPRYAMVVGGRPEDDRILSVDTLRYNEPGNHLWDTVKGVYAGFRVVLQPR